MLLGSRYLERWINIRIKKKDATHHLTHIDIILLLTSSHHLTSSLGGKVEDLVRLAEPKLVPRLHSSLAKRRHCMWHKILFVCMKFSCSKILKGGFLTFERNQFLLQSKSSSASHLILGCLCEVGEEGSAKPGCGCWGGWGSNLMTSKIQMRVLSGDQN